MAKNLKLELKTWFSLEEAAEIVSEEINEVITAKDILDCAVTGLIDIYLINLGKIALVKFDYNESCDYDEILEVFYMSCFLRLSQEYCIDIVEKGVCYVSSFDSVFDLSGNLCDATSDFIPNEGKISGYKVLAVPDEYVIDCRVNPDYFSHLKYDVKNSGEKTTPSDVVTLKKDVLKFVEHCKSINTLSGTVGEGNQTKPKQNPINDRNTLLNIITALKEALIDKGVFENQAHIIDYLVNEYEDRGLSESNLKAKFAEANALKKSN